MNRKEFPMLENDIFYFDNAATTFKPKKVIDKMVEYYTKYTSNAHRGDYFISYKTNEMLEETRENTRKFIGASKKEEIIFTSGATESLNMITNGFFRYKLKKDDEVIISKSEHASNVLPWLKLKKENKIKVKYIPLNEKNEIDIKELEKMINIKTKVISLAHITNVIGDIRDIKRIVKLAKKSGIYTVIDAAQSIGHIKTDVLDMDCDFLVFSAHKMYGPTGVGVLYGKEKLLNQFIPVNMGGGMNESFNDDAVIFKPLPYKLEAGTINIAGIIAFNEAIKFIEKLDLDVINNYEVKLKEYLVEKLKEIEYIKVYNPESKRSIVILNAKGVFASDLAMYLNSKNICVRAGNHCVKMLKEQTNFSNTVRISLALYNTKEEIDYLINVLKDKESLYNY